MGLASVLCFLEVLAMTGQPPAEGGQPPSAPRCPESRWEARLVLILRGETAVSLDLHGGITAVAMASVVCAAPSFVQWRPVPLLLGPLHTCCSALAGSPPARWEVARVRCKFTGFT